MSGHTPLEYMLLTYHDENRQGTTDRPATKIEITEEMIAAGARQLALFDPDFATMREGAEKVILAALEAGGY